MKNKKQAASKLQLNGVVYKTNGNIQFKQTDFVLASSTLLKDIDGIVENGLQTLLRKLKTRK